MKKKIRGLLMLVIFCLLIILSVNGNVLAAETEEAVVVAEGTCGESLFWSLEEDGRLYIRNRRNGRLRKTRGTTAGAMYTCSGGKQ